MSATRFAVLANPLSEAASTVYACRRETPVDLPHLGLVADGCSYNSCRQMPTSSYCGEADGSGQGILMTSPCCWTLNDASDTANGSSQRRVATAGGARRLRATAKRAAVTNPFVGAAFYANPDYAKAAATSLAKFSSISADASRIRAVQVSLHPKLTVTKQC